MTTDSISDLFTRIRNASFVRQEKVCVPSNKTNKSLIKILAFHGFLQNFCQINNQTLQLTLKYKKNQPIIVQLQRLSRPGCRLYIQVRNIPQICGKLGIPTVLFLSTPKGILSDREACRLKVGGEILGYVS
uniref:Small ribosomal subunit protein uS8c n=1 Tax=Rhipiliopsis peltata TaxID=2320810 RepID=A0A386B1D2_9CHLO|nr:ribosomal protein S8 [Rhipiliopsis peltata]AYC65497.1 ribosomal protein S8 [Rhipiliopsis peltata]